MHDASNREYLNGLAEQLHDYFMDLVRNEELDVQGGLSLLECFVETELRLIRHNLINADIPHPDRRIWQCIATVCHALAHAPDGARPDADAWLHEQDED